MSPNQIPRKQAAKTSGVASNPVAVKAAPPSMAASSEMNVMKKRDPALANAVLMGIAIITGSRRSASSLILKRRRCQAEILRHRKFSQTADQGDQCVMVHGVEHRIHNFP